MPNDYYPPSPQYVPGYEEVSLVLSVDLGPAPEREDPQDSVQKQLDKTEGIEVKEEKGEEYTKHKAQTQMT